MSRDCVVLVTVLGLVGDGVGRSLLCSQQLPCMGVLCPRGNQGRLCAQAVAEYPVRHPTVVQPTVTTRYSGAFLFVLFSSL